MTRAVNVAQVGSGSGAIVQTVVKAFTDATSNTSTSAYIAVNNGNLNITPLFSNSQFLVTIIGQCYQSSAQGTNIGLQRTVNAVTTRLLGVDGVTGDTWIGFGNNVPAVSGTITRLALDSPSVAAGTVITYQMLLGHWSNSGTSFLNYVGYTLTSSIMIQEIAV